MRATTYEENVFFESFKTIQKEIHETAKSKGWWESENSIGEMIALMHSELSEALEAARKGNPASEKIPEFSCEEEEFADTIIRIMDFSESHGYRIAEAIIAKAEYNKGRAFRHGGKLF